MTSTLFEASYSARKFTFRFQAFIGLLVLQGHHIATAQQCIDFEGNVYQTVQIGNQLWMKENLRATRYKDGSVIAYIPGSSQSLWSSTQQGAYSYYNDTSSTTSQYGVLYNWFAVSSAIGICPQGWHSPSDSEWFTLMYTLGLPQSTPCLHQTCGVAENIGGQLKSTAPSWNNPNSGATNSSGFTAVPGGRRNPSSQPAYSGLGNYGYYWTSSSSSPNFAYYRLLDATSQGIYRGDIYGDKYRQTGMSCRCIYDNPVGIIDNYNKQSSLNIVMIGTSLHISNTTESTFFQIFDTTGRMIISGRGSIGSSTINLSNIESSIYIISVTESNYRISHRFLLNHQE